VGAAVYRGDRVLLIRRGKPPLAGAWSLPGGLADTGESLAMAAAREVAEECGIRIQVVDLITLFEYIERDPSGRARYHYLVFDFAARYRGGALGHASDAADARWVGIPDMDRLEMSKEVRRVVRQGLGILR
jgi:ADP-ribose pyrophosphatase